ncbi:MAG: DUF5104 domain-containing protein [Lachnospiraceae bacterium]|nr:DUF5104 domain-containing protein [Lachnospiraceae bacterium]
MVKKFLIISLLLVCVLLTSCTMKYHSDIKKETKTWINYFKEEDAEGLLELFCSDIKNNYYDETLEEIEAAFEFIDGDIVSYKYKGEGSSGQTKDDFKTKLYYCYPEYQIETSTGKKYTIMFRYNYIWKEKPEYEGIARIWIVNYQGDDEFDGDEVVVGRVYEVDKE